MARFSLSASCTSRTVDGPRIQRTRRISSSDAVGFCRSRFMEENHTTKAFVVSTKIFVCYEKSMQEKMQTGSYSGPEVGFGDIATHLLQARFWTASCSCPVWRTLKIGVPRHVYGSGVRKPAQNCAVEAP